MVYLIIAAIAAFVLILSVLFFVAVCRSKRRKEEQEEESVLEGKEIVPPSVNHGTTTAFSVASTLPADYMTTNTVTDFKFDPWKAAAGNANDFDIFGHYPVGNSGPTSWSYNQNYAMLLTPYSSSHELNPSCELSPGWE